MTTSTLTLYVNGKTPRTQRAIQNVREVCNTELPDFLFDVVDTQEQPRKAKLDNVRSTPTLVKKTGSSKEWIICNFDKKSEVVKGLNIDDTHSVPANRDQKQEDQGA